MIANGVADSLTKFLCDSLCNVDSCQSTGLMTDALEPVRLSTFSSLQGAAGLGVVLM